MNAELEAAIPAIPMTRLIIVPAPVMDMGADATMLRIVPAPVTDMGADATMIRLVPTIRTDMEANATALRQGMDTTMDPISKDEGTAKVHVYQTPLASNVG